MPKGDPVLDRPYGPADLAPALAAHGIAATVLVQAAPSVAETEYMLGLADATPSVAGVVGWVDFEDPTSPAVLARLAGHPVFKGVRPMIQDIPDLDWMLRPDIAWAFEALISLDLTFDALGYPAHLQPFATLLSRYPELRVVIDHGMKPRVREAMAGLDAFTDWATGMRALAARPGTHCKLSGLVTEAAPGWHISDLAPFVAHILEVFGPERVMWGSDWPVCRLRAEYSAWWEAAEALTADLAPSDRAAVFGGTARAFYKLA